MKRDYKITREKFFNTEERKAILKVCEEKAHVDIAKGRMTWPIRYMLVHLAMNTGLRVSEIAALRIADIHWKDKTPYIFVRQGKRKKDRDVYIDRELTQHLRQFFWQKSQLWDQSNAPPDPLFSGRSGQPFTTTALNLSFKQAVRAAGLRDTLSIHSARHTYATLLYHKTQNLRYVQKQLGHSNLNMTILYADIMPEVNGNLANMILDDEPEEQPKPAISEPNCLKRKCIHYSGIIKPDGTEMTERPACSAYPEGIPDEIAYGRVKHLRVRPDQNNDIVFETSKS